MVSKTICRGSNPLACAIGEKSSAVQLRLPDLIQQLDLYSNNSYLVNDNLALSGGTIKMYGVHFTIAWQNGTGLNNPTIRVFLEG